VGRPWLQSATGIGRIEKTGHKGAAKNPRWLKACNTTSSDMGEFFFISMNMKLLFKSLSDYKDGKFT
jgi:hypothetical protein